MNTNFNVNELRKIDLNLLLILSVLVQEESVRKAAQRLKVGSPAVSMSLSRLRDLLDDPLLIRSSKGMVPTPRARELVAMIDPFLRDLHVRLADKTAFDPKTASRTFRFAIADDLEAILLPTLIGQMREQAPNVKLIVRDGDFNATERLLQSGEADVVFAATVPEVTLREPTRVLYRDHFVVLFDPSQVLLGDQLTLEEYVETPQLLVSPRGDAYGMLEEPLKYLGRSREVVATLTRFSTLPMVLKQTPVICNVPKTTGMHLAGEFGLDLRALPFRSVEFDVGLSWQRALDRDPLTRWFVELVSQLVSEFRERHSCAGND